MVRTGLGPSIRAGLGSAQPEAWCCSCNIHSNMNDKKKDEEIEEIAKIAMLQRVALAVANACPNDSVRHLS